MSKSTIDNRMLILFSKFKWWESNNLLQKINGLRTSFVFNTLAELKKLSPEGIDFNMSLKNLVALDVGCGGGIFSEKLAEMGCTVVGIDPGIEAIKAAKKHCLETNFLVKNLSYHVELVEEHQKQHFNKYDVVILFDVLEHINNPQIILESCVKCLKPGGSIFITTVNRTWMAWIIGILLLECITKTIAKRTHDYEKFITPAEVGDLLRKHNCEVKSIRGISYNFLNKSMSWSSSTSFLYALHAIKNS